MLLMPTEIKPKFSESRWNSSFLPGADVPHAYVCLDTMLIPQLLEGADSVGGQLRGDKEFPFSGVTSRGRVWRRMPESDAGSVH